jgi:hypothetical protein
VAGFISEWWPESNRNGGRNQIGIPGRIASEFAVRRIDLKIITSDPDLSAIAKDVEALNDA